MRAGQARSSSGKIQGLSVAIHPAEANFHQEGKGRKNWIENYLKNELPRSGKSLKKFSDVAEMLRSGRLYWRKIMKLTGTGMVYRKKLLSQRPLDRKKRTIGTGFDLAGATAARKGRMLAGSLYALVLLGISLPQPAAAATEGDYTQTLPPYATQPAYTGTLPPGFPPPPVPPVPPVIPPLPGEEGVAMPNIPAANDRPATPPAPVFPDSAPAATPAPVRPAPVAEPAPAPAPAEPATVAEPARPAPQPVAEPAPQPEPAAASGHDASADHAGDHAAGPAESDPMQLVPTGATGEVEPDHSASHAEPVRPRPVVESQPEPEPAPQPSRPVATGSNVTLSAEELQILPDDAEIIGGQQPFAPASQPHSEPEPVKPPRATTVQGLVRQREAERAAAEAAAAEEEKKQTGELWPDEPTKDFEPVDGFRVGYVPQFPSGSLFVMMEEKWPEKVGFEVAPKTFRRMEAMAMKLKEGKLDMAYFDPVQFLKLRQEGYDLVVVAGTMVDSTAMVARGSLARSVIAGEAGRGLRHWIKVNTRRLTIGSGERMTVRHEVMRVWGIENGRLSPETLRLPGADLERIWRAMLGHKILAAVVPEPMVSTIIARDPGARVILDGSRMGTGIPNLLLVSTPRALAARRGNMVDFVGMHVEGQQMMRENPGRAGFHMARYIGYGHLDATEMGRALMSSLNRYEADPVKVTPGLLELQKQLVNDGTFGQPLDAVDMVNSSLYREATRGGNQFYHEDMAANDNHSPAMQPASATGAHSAPAATGHSAPAH